MSLCVTWQNAYTTGDSLRIGLENGLRRKKICFSYKSVERCLFWVSFEQVFIDMGLQSDVSTCLSGRCQFLCDMWPICAIDMKFCFSKQYRYITKYLILYPTNYYIFVCTMANTRCLTLVNTLISTNMKVKYCLGFLYIQNNWIFLSMTSFCCLQVSFIRSCGKYSPSNFDVKKMLTSIILYY